MKRIVTPYLVLSLCLLLPPLVVGCGSADPATVLVGTWKLESFANGPEVFAEFDLFKDGTALAKDERLQKQQGLSPEMGVSGTWKVDNNRLTLMFGAQGMTLDYSLSGATLTFIYDKNTNYHAVYLRPAEWEQAQQARKAEKARKAEEAIKAAGFIAQPEIAKTWAEAIAYCGKMGGRLPRVNNSDSVPRSFPLFDGSVPPEHNIEGFGKHGDSMPYGFPAGGYWTATVDTENPDYPWILNISNDKVDVGFMYHTSPPFAICVPGEDKDREFWAERTRKAAGFIALSEFGMNLADAKAFCQRHGGQLPRINNSDSWALADKDRITHLDGFGAPGRPWAELALPTGTYWTATVATERPHLSWTASGGFYTVHDYDGGIQINGGTPANNLLPRGVCVP